jgi:5-methylcytosine-specific restriction endonuclease McrBC regulatory subunit McrC
MATWTITESTVTELTNFDLDWLPNAAHRYVTPQIRHSRGGITSIALEVGPWIGTMPLANGDVLRILPRAGEKALWRMLMLSEGLADQFNKEFEDFTRVSYTEEGATSWMQLLARAFFKQLRAIEKESLRTDRIEVSRRLPSARGRVALLPTVASIMRREVSPVHCTFKERTYETVEHRVLGAAALRLFQLGFVSDDDQMLAFRWIDRAQERLKERELLEVARGLRARRYTGPRNYYIPALLMARLLLAEAGISFDEEASVESEVLMTNVRTLFERYVRAVIAEALRDKGFVVEKREDAPMSLFDDGTCSLIPDALISKARVITLIADAKYKIDKPVEESDYYQMAAYLDTYSVQNGLLIMPSLVHHTVHIVSHRTRRGYVIHEIRVPLEDWTVTERYLTTEVRRMAGS